MVIFFQGYIIFDPKKPKVAKFVGATAIVVLFTQIILGALTVLRLLESKVVTLHLALGVLLFALLLWNYWIISESARHEKLNARAQAWAIFLAMAVYIQILLGGMVSTNYAGLACPDVPKCLGQWWPEFQGLVALHMTHRLGAIAIFLLVITNFILDQRKKTSLHLSAKSNSVYPMGSLATWMLIVTCIQIAVGVSNVVFRIPPLVTVVHLVLGATLFALTLRKAYITQA